MEFYLSIDGNKEGPFPVLKVGDLLERGEISPETLAWHRDQEGWLPINEIPALESMVEAATKTKHQEEEEETPKEIQPSLAPGTATPPALPPSAAIRTVRPFTRFWARMFDLLLVSTIVYSFIDLSFIAPKEGEPVSDWLARYTETINSPEWMAVVGVIMRSLLVWHFLEAVMLHLFGTTPGKALFGIRVSQEDGSQIPLMKALGRSFYVYFMGVGFYLFPFMLIGMTFSFFRLMATGKCLWDQHLKLETTTQPTSPTRIMLAIFAFFVLLMLQSLKFS